MRNHFKVSSLVDDVVQLYGHYTTYDVVFIYTSAYLYVIALNLYMDCITTRPN